MGKMHNLKETGKRGEPVGEMHNCKERREEGKEGGANA